MKPSRFSVLRRMADEQAVVDKALQCAHRRILGFCWSNDRDRSELLVQEDRGLRHDEVGLEFIGDFRIGESIEVGKVTVAPVEPGKPVSVSVN